MVRGSGIQRRAVSSECQTPTRIITLGPVNSYSVCRAQYCKPQGICKKMVLEAKKGSGGNSPEKEGLTGAWETLAEVRLLGVLGWGPGQSGE